MQKPVEILYIMLYNEDVKIEVRILIIAIIVISVALAIACSIIAENRSNELQREYSELQAEVLEELGFLDWNIVSYFDEYVAVNSRRALEKYDEISFFKENKEKLASAQGIIKRKTEVATTLNMFLENNNFKLHTQYDRLTRQIDAVLVNADAYRIRVQYTSPAGRNVVTKEIMLRQDDIARFEKDTTLLMTKGEYSKFLKEQQKESLSQRQREYYERVNKLIDYANANKDFLIVKESCDQLDNLIAQLFDRTVNSIKKIKTLDSEEWQVIGDYIVHIQKEMGILVSINNQLLKYYESSEFLRIKETCGALRSSQREFNEYISEKIQDVARLLGTRAVRNETVYEDEYNYIRPS